MRLGLYKSTMAIMLALALLPGLSFISLEAWARGGGGGFHGAGGFHGGGGYHGSFGGGSFREGGGFDRREGGYGHQPGPDNRRPDNYPHGPDHHRPDNNYNRDINVNRNVNVSGSGWGGYSGPGWGGVAAGLAVGTMVGALSANAQRVLVGGQTYYYENNTYYQPCYQGSDLNYCVVPNPNQ